jgi:hypothetical protein
VAGTVQQSLAAGADAAARARRAVKDAVVGVLVVGILGGGMGRAWQTFLKNVFHHISQHSFIGIHAIV